MLMGTQIQIALQMRIFFKSQICACCTQSSPVLNICSNNGSIQALVYAYKQCFVLLQ